MKKTYELLIILMLVFTLFLSGCSDQSHTSEFSTDENGNRILNSDERTTCFPEKLPVDVKYNDTHISLESVNFYQNESNYSYNLFLVITLDVSHLSDAQIHWLRESDLNVSAYLTHEKNQYDFDTMSSLGSLLVEDQGKLYFVKTSSFFRENRYEFSEAEVVVGIDISQEETYPYTNSEGKVTNLNRRECIHYSVLVPNYISSAESIPKPLYNYVADWLYDLANLYS